ncbi:PREDICTED: uncharacterized protein LOC109238655 [Nicotiana attenuata]|uniref:uncharacterized protein LOC109238655 n=1 Tax=Nicotiana attenuata TaxID=49451 RepID=UPI000904E0AE|nr:PREDICTED: uncharacterized protein LOC109238655 [Nicotiana attenuata]
MSKKMKIVMVILIRMRSIKQRKRSTWLVDVGVGKTTSENVDDHKWFEMCDLGAHKLICELGKQTTIEDLSSCQMSKQSGDENVPAVDIRKQSTTKMFSHYKVGMSDSQIESQIHKLSSEIANQSICVGPVMCSMSNCSTTKGATMSSLPIQLTCEEVQAYVVSDDSI